MPVFGKPFSQQEVIIARRVEELQVLSAAMIGKYTRKATAPIVLVFRLNQYAQVVRCQCVQN